jgi:xylulose-5-phosphate/fructose-6-phosphate phosphoketolase
LRLPHFPDYALKFEKPGTLEVENEPLLGEFLRDVMKANMTKFRVFGPDETTSNKLQAVYEAAKKFWIAEYFPEDKDGTEIATDGRVIEMLSEHTVEGMLEGYLLTGRHGFISSYEAFVHVIDSMFNQHAKWLSICNHLSRDSLHCRIRFPGGRAKSFFPLRTRRQVTATRPEVSA